MKINNLVLDLEFCVGVSVTTRGSICINLEMKHLQMMQTTTREWRYLSRYIDISRVFRHIVVYLLYIEGKSGHFNNVVVLMKA